MALPVIFISRDSWRISRAWCMGNLAWLIALLRNWVRLGKNNQFRRIRVHNEGNDPESEWEEGVSYMARIPVHHDENWCPS